MPRSALVTGGASGLGAASAARLRAEGLTVTTLDISGPADVTADVTDEAALREAAGRIGPVDVLVNSAGIVGANKPLLETTAQEWQRVLDINVLGTVNTMRVFVPGMCDRGWGRVVNLASMAGKDGNTCRGLRLVANAWRLYRQAVPLRFGWEPVNLKLRKGGAEEIAQWAGQVLAGVSPRQIALDLGRRQVPSSRGGQWSSAQVRYTLLNPAIMGRLAYRPAVPAGVPRLSKNRSSPRTRSSPAAGRRGTRSSPNPITGLSGRS